MQKALDSAPWAAPFILVAFLLRKEIAALLTAGKSDGALERLMTEQVAMFRQNLEYFEAVAGHTNTMQRCLTELLDVQRAVQLEVARQGGHRP